jgi:hypothetical protein
MKRSIAIFISCVFFFSAFLNLSRAETSGNFEMGFLPIPRQPISKTHWIELFELLKDNADTLLHHAQINWKNPLDIESSRFIVGMSRSYGLKLFIVVDPLSPNRNSLDPNLPKDFRPNFADKNVREGFKRFTLKLCTEFKPEYLALGSEVNSYFLQHPEEIKNFLYLYKETYAAVKKISPETKITVTFQFESLSGTSGNKPQWELISMFEPDLDVLAISTYPSFWFASPSQMPPDYYSRLRKFSAKPLVIAESGWPSGGAKAYHGSAENQRQFLLRVAELTKGLDLKLWIWWFLHDWKGKEYADYFKTMGLKEANGVEKPAWITWQQLHRLKSPVPGTVVQPNVNK